MGAEAVALAVLSPLLGVLFERLATVQTKQWLIELFKGTELKDDLLQKMEISLLRVEKVLGDAEEKQIMNPSVKKWVDKLIDAAYDAEDLLDSMAIEGPFQEKQVQDFNSRLEKIVKRLDLIASEKDILDLKEGQGGKLLQRLPTTSLVDESEECFRNDDKKHILDILLSDDVNGQKIPVIAIVGMGGSGKTTLAQFLYNDDRVKSYFTVGAWVYVSEEFDVFKVTKTIYESATFSRSDIEDLNVLQLKLQRTLMGKKFLLVLDDVWNESYREWDLLRRPLQFGAPGSKIIVTTRSQSVASTMLPALVHDLKRLSKEDCWSLFSKHAFGNRDPNEDSTLKAIGDKIVEKCRGLPLAIKTLGSLLHSQIEAEEWDNVLNSRIWDLPDHKSDILPALRLSYHYLPSQLKPCFAYCSIFPKGHKFEKGDLVRMWIAAGLVQQPHSRRKEEVGEQYFQELLSRSIFQQSHDESRFIMHDLVNDLAQYIAGEFFFRFEHDSGPQNPARVRHLSCILKPSDNPYKFEAFYGKNNFLRTFLPLRSPGDGKTPFDSGVFNKLFPAPSCLRVLSLSSHNITEFPDSVCNVKQLRYLDLSGAALPCLPESIGRLHNLETLKLSGCPRLTLLPANLSNLTKLEHLDIKRTPILQMPPNFGNLKRLQLLTNFVVGNNSGSTTSEIRDLSLLHGTLSISRLQNVSQTADAEKTNLKDKKYLRELILEWDVDPCKGNAQNAAYDPHNENIESAAGDRLNGNAQNAADDPHNSNGQNAADDPHNGHAENAAEPLNGRAQNAAGDPCNGNVNKAANDPQDCDAEIAAGNLHINGNTQNAVGDSQNRSGQSAVDDHQNPSAKHAVNVLDKLQPCENLERLKIKNFFGMSLPRWLGNASFSKMKSITLGNCQNCNSLPPLGQLPSLKELDIHDMAGVKILGPEFYGGGVMAFKSLEKLWFENMENWEQWLPSCNGRGFPSLRTLTLFRCRKLTGDLPIQHLILTVDIKECDNLTRRQGTTNE